MATANPAPDVEIDPEHTPIFTTPPERPTGLTEYRLKQLEGVVAKQGEKFDAHQAAIGLSFKEVNTSITDLTGQVAGMAGTVEAMSSTVSQAMEIVTASAKGAIQVNTTRETVIIKDGADARASRRAFSLKVIAILGTIATAITTAIAAGRC